MIHRFIGCVFGVCSMYALTPQISALEKDCQVETVSIEFAPRNINTDYYIDEVSNYLKTYKCDFDENDADDLVSAALQLSFLAHSLTLVPDLSLGAIGKDFMRKPELNDLRGELIREVRILESQVLWNLVDREDEHSTEIQKFICDLTFSLISSRSETCPTSREWMLKKTRTVSRQFNVAMVQDYLFESRY